MQILHLSKFDRLFAARKTKWEKATLIQYTFEPGFYRKFPGGAGRNTLEYLGLWEMLNNPNFKKGVEFDPLLKEAGSNSFTMSPNRWIELTGAIGIINRLGHEGGTYAQRDIAFKFASWVSVEFELYLIKEFQRLKEAEQAQIGWSAKRELSKINYHIHTGAVSRHLVPAEVTPAQAGVIYGSARHPVHSIVQLKTCGQGRSDAGQDVEASGETAKNQNEKPQKTKIKSEKRPMDLSLNVWP